VRRGKASGAFTQMSAGYTADRPEEFAAMTTRVHIKRAIYEWGALAAGGAAVGCLVLWFLSVTGWITSIFSPWDLKLSVGEWKHLTIADGALTLGKQLKSFDDVEDLRRDGTLAAARQYRWELPGLIFQYVGLPGFEPWWIVRGSLLIPTTVLGVLAIILAFKLRGVRRTLAAIPLPAPVEPPCPLDVAD
jgi:hypothetical protein